MVSITEWTFVKIHITVLGVIPIPCVYKTPLNFIPLTTSETASLPLEEM